MRVPLCACICACICACVLARNAERHLQLSEARRLLPPHRLHPLRARARARPRTSAEKAAPVNVRTQEAIEVLAFDFFKRLASVESAGLEADESRSRKHKHSGI